MVGKEPALLNSEFTSVLDLIENQNEHVFITGRAGTGKSTLLNILKKTTRKNAAVVAPTGIAALNVGGQTIHSFFKLPPKMVDPRELTKRKNHRFYKKLKLLIIDEISMVRADMMDCIDIFLRNNRENNAPFGGVQLVVFGDLFQLPPVVSSAFERQYLKERYGTPYFFAAHVFNEIELRMIELRTVYRQTERRFINLLDNIRLRHIDHDVMDEINQRYSEEDPEEMAITLCATNAKVNSINSTRLKSLTSPLFEYKSKMTGNFNERISPADNVLWLKEGAQIMFVKNDPEGQFVNGTIGRVEKLDYDKIIVAIQKEGEIKYINVDQADWEMMKYEMDAEDPEKFKTSVTGTFTQYPLKLAWAITIHKSQGKTFDNIIVDLGRGAFDYGQTYVALSRCRTLDGITLRKKITPRDILVDPTIVEYYDYKIRNW
ncbi:MAG: AAA family ATPase [Saprospiraceae bacterium]|nr:AAA family ATPase [Saprospiraceae bacterium]